MILPSTDEFNFKECRFGKDLCWLITPKLAGVTWTKENSRFRSVIVRQFDNLVISQGFRKFTNFGEQPLFEPWEESFWPCEARLKLDGSLFIVSKYNGELIIRTRGSTDTVTMKNADEVSAFIKQYPKAFDNELLNSECYSLLFEWTSPKNIIVLKEHEVPTLTLIGMAEHLTAEYPTQDFLDDLAITIGVGRPQKYIFDSYNELVKTVKPWTDSEGVVMFSSDYQVLKKIKADRYCYLHKLASGFATINGILDAYFSAPELYSTVEEFYKYIENIADFEIAENNKELIERVIHARNAAYAGKELAEHFVKYNVPPTLPIADRAKEITRRFGNDSIMKAFAFNALHRKETDIIKKAIIAKAKA